jgi:hypothetical protein
MEIVKVAVAEFCVFGLVFVFVSSTLTVNEDVPLSEPFAFPEMAPDFLLRRSPAGSFPEMMDHLYGGFPPAASRAAAYEAPTVADGNEVVVICSGMVTDSVSAVELLGRSPASPL